MKQRYKPWSKRELALLGTDLDHVIAAKLGLATTTICNLRLELGIRAFRPRKRIWTKAETALLGRLPDGAIAAKIGNATRKHVQEHRAQLGIAPWQAKKRKR